MGRKSIAAVTGALVACSVVLPSSAAPKAGETPKPVIALAGAGAYEAGGKTWVRHRYVVRNWAQFPAELFAVSPELPPCGRNPNASRTWVDFYEASGKRLYGFCALQKPADLRCLWFATEFGSPPPAKVYIELTDRGTGKTFRSNLAGTGPARPGPKASAAALAVAAKAGCLFAAEAKK